MPDKEVLRADAVVIGAGLDRPGDGLSHQRVGLVAELAVIHRAQHVASVTIVQYRPLGQQRVFDNGQRLVARVDRLPQRWCDLALESGHP
jgi:hypothetical protein